MSDNRRPTSGRLAEKHAQRRSFLKGTTAAPILFAMPSLASGSPSVTKSPTSLADDGLAAAPPSALGIDAGALSAILNGVRNGPANIHSLIVMRHGKLASELYRSGADRSIYSLSASERSFTPADRHDMRSISKSVVGLLYGILLDRGAVPDIETPVASLYPECRDLDDAARRAIRIRHLLTMTAGLDWSEPSPVRRATSTEEVGLALRPCAYSYVFGHDVAAPPGTQFTYSGGLTAVLGEIIARSTKRSLREIADEDLFTPLGIHDWEWIGDIYGKPMAPQGLRLRPRDLMKIGAMMLAGGRWHERRIVPADWIARSTQPIIATAPVGGYGFQWWSMTVPRNRRNLPVHAAIGNGGQRLFLVPDLDLAVVTTAGDYGDPAIARPLNDILHAVVAAVSA